MKKFIVSLSLALAGTTLMAAEGSLQAWDNAPVPVTVTGKKVGIRDVSLALTRAYRETVPCAELFAKLGKETHAKAAGTAVSLDAVNAFATCERETPELALEITYWKRKDGHYLVGMTTRYDDGKSGGEDLKQEVYFYDLDPAAKAPQLQAETALTDTLRDLKSYSYLIRLPQQGKHLVFQEHEGAGGATRYLQWDGQTFATTLSQEKP